MLFARVAHGFAPHSDAAYRGGVGVRLSRKAVAEDLRTRRVGRRLIYRLRTTSTMDDARAAAEDGAPTGTVVIAEEQSRGRGTRGRSWVSPGGQNLYFTIVVRPSAARLQRLSILTAVAVANAVEQVVNLYPRIKWPNDLHLRGKKFVGILVESEWVGGRPRFALVGIGINVNFDPGAFGGAIEGPATSLALERGRPLAREPILAATLNAFERAYDGATTPALLQGWRARLETLGRPVSLADQAGGVVEGVAEDVTEEGALVVRLETGERRRFLAGEVSLRPPAASPTPP